MKKEIIVITSVSIIVVLLIYGFGYWQINKLQQTLIIKQKTIDSLKGTLVDKEKTIDLLQSLLWVGRYKNSIKISTIGTTGTIRSARKKYLDKLTLYP